MSRKGSPGSLHLELPEDLLARVRSIAKAESSTMVQTIATILRRAVTVRIELTLDDAQLMLGLLLRLAGEPTITDATMAQVERITDILERAYPELVKA